MFMTAKQAAEKWGLSDRRVRILCSEGKIPGALQEGRSWKTPMDVTYYDRREPKLRNMLEEVCIITPEFNDSAATILPPL